MFRRRGSVAEQTPESTGGSPAGSGRSPDDGGHGTTEGKGRPTPKRRDAEGRRQPIVAPRDRKEAYRQVKRRQKEQRKRVRAGIAAGEERYLPARDRGPVRRLARDLVDSRRSVGEFFLYIALIVIVLTTVPVMEVQLIAYNVAFPVLIIAVAADSMMMSRRVKREVLERYPSESTRGLAFYIITRSLQIRRLRMPPPQVRPGDRV